MSKNILIILLCFVIMLLCMFIMEGRFCYCQPVRCPKCDLKVDIYKAYLS